MLAISQGFVVPNMIARLTNFLVAPGVLTPDSQYTESGKISTNW